MNKYMVLEIFKFQKGIARDFENFQILKKMHNFGRCQKKKKYLVLKIWIFQFFKRFWKFSKFEKMYGLDVLEKLSNFQRYMEIYMILKIFKFWKNVQFRCFHTFKKWIVLEIFKFPKIHENIRDFENFEVAKLWKNNWFWKFGFFQRYMILKIFKFWKNTRFRCFHTLRKIYIVLEILEIFKLFWKSRKQNESERKSISRYYSRSKF